MGYSYRVTCTKRELKEGVIGGNYDEEFYATLLLYVGYIARSYKGKKRERERWDEVWWGRLDKCSNVKDLLEGTTECLEIGEIFPMKIILWHSYIISRKLT